MSAYTDVSGVLKQVGKPVQIYPSPDDAVERDEYQSVVSRETASPNVIELNAFPIIFSPSDKQREKAGITEPCDVLLYFSKFDLDELGRNFDEIQIATGTLTIGIRSYEITQKALVSEYGEDWIYFTIGCKIR